MEPTANGLVMSTVFSLVLLAFVGSSAAADRVLAAPATPLAVTDLSWASAHANPNNDGYLPVITAPAGAGSVSIPQIGTFAPGVGPVTGTNGDVYIGNQEGTVFAFHANGTPAWRRDLPHGHAIKSPPLVTSDGSIFVVSGTTVNDHRGGIDRTRRELFLHRFTPGGGWSGPLPFPEQYSSFELYRGSGATTAPLNVWRFQGAEVLMVPVGYRVPGGMQLRIVALSTQGAFLGDALLRSVRDEVTADSVLDQLEDLLGAKYWHGEVGPFVQPPLGGAAVFTNPLGGQPFVMVPDGAADLVGLIFDFTGDKGRFIEVLRDHADKRVLTSPPMTRSDAHTIISTDDARVLFAGPGGRPVPPVHLESFSYAAPTRTTDGRLVIVGDGSLAVLRDGQVLSQVKLPGRSIASAAASRTHIYVSTSNALLTFDANTLKQVQRFDWVGGGVSAPVIGPQGHVYAMASNIIFVFPPPTSTPLPPVTTGSDPTSPRDAPGHGRAPVVRDHR